MKISVTCKTCGRDLLATQAIEGGGSCPWCGTPFSPDYAATLVAHLRDAVDAGERFEHALEGLADLKPGFTVDVESVLGAIKRDLARLEGTALQRS